MILDLLCVTNVDAVLTKYGLRLATSQWYQRMALSQRFIEQQSAKTYGNNRHDELKTVFCPPTRDQIEPQVHGILSSCRCPNKVDERIAVAPLAWTASARQLRPVISPVSALHFLASPLVRITSRSGQHVGKASWANRSDHADAEGRWRLPRPSQQPRARRVDSRLRIARRHRQTFPDSDVFVAKRGRHRVIIEDALTAVVLMSVGQESRQPHPPSPQHQAMTILMLLKEHA